MWETDFPAARGSASACRCRAEWVQQRTHVFSKIEFFSVNTENIFANPVRFLFCVKSTSFLFLPLVSTGAQREEFESRAGFQLFAYGSGQLSSFVLRLLSTALESRFGTGKSWVTDKIIFLHTAFQKSFQRTQLPAWIRISGCFTQWLTSGNDQKKKYHRKI